MRRVLWIPLLVLVGSCVHNYVGDERSPFYTPPPGSRLLLKQVLTIPAEMVGVFIQGGRAVSNREVDQYYPHCRLEVRERRETEQTVEPDEFVIEQVRRDVEVVSNTDAVPVRVSHGGGPSFFIYRTLLYLKSAHQPQVRLLICQHWGDPALDTHLSIHDIRQALGELMVLQLPVPSAGG
jgi:hypothetical protein